ncbi:hypothetical protein M9Y10_012506 [Tritrichomonas musculus]|uniref:Serine-threonine/tyrosine-protein kinase catalytic domain-containing protein n=1 Tax=Tritrichomonas musculus TaxID=1915356 RepID=A0ABR2IDA2_9EUKA
MESLLNRCWSQKAEGRPSLGEIYEELSGDFSMLGEDADVEEVHDFIKCLMSKNNRKKLFQTHQAKNL